MKTSLMYLAEGLAIDRAIDEPQRLDPIDLAWTAADGDGKEGFSGISLEPQGRYAGCQVYLKSLNWASKAWKLFWKPNTCLLASDRT